MTYCKNKRVYKFCKLAYVSFGSFNWNRTRDLILYIFIFLYFPINIDITSFTYFCFLLKARVI